MSAPPHPSTLLQRRKGGEVRRRGVTLRLDVQMSSGRMAYSSKVEREREKGRANVFRFMFTRAPTHTFPSPTHARTQLLTGSLNFTRAKSSYRWDGNIGSSLRLAKGILVASIFCNLFSAVY